MAQRHRVSYNNFTRASGLDITNLTVGSLSSGIFGFYQNLATQATHNLMDTPYISAQSL